MKDLKIWTMALAGMAGVITAPTGAQDRELTEEMIGVPPPAPAGWDAPRTPWGDPDLRGTYPLESMGSTPMQRPERFGTRKLLNDEEYAASLEQAERVEGQADAEDRANTLGAGNWFERGEPLRQTSLIVEPADGRVPPMTERGSALRAQMSDSWNTEVFEGPWHFNSLDRCLSRGLPASMIPFPYNNGLRVFQSPGYVVINLEMIHETRIIPLGDVERPAAPIRSFLGTSRGHWDGNTLVVETTNFNGESPMVIVGPSNDPIPTSDQLKVTEHFTIYGPKQVYYEAWIEDPVVLTEPFKLGFPWSRDDSYEPYEYACHEGNTIIPAYILATSPRYADYRVERGGTRDPAPVN